MTGRENAFPQIESEQDAHGDWYTTSAGGMTKLQYMMAHVSQLPGGIPVHSICKKLGIDEPEIAPDDLRGWFKWYVTADALWRRAQAEEFLRVSELED